MNKTIIDTEVEIVVDDNGETKERVISNYVSMIELENNFIDFKKTNTVNSLEITETIKMMELDTVKDLVLDAKAKIEEYTFGQQEGFLNKTKYFAHSIPLIGGAVKQGIEKYQRKRDEHSNIKDVFQNLFDNFTLKQNRIIELAEMLNNMKIKIQEQEEYILDILSLTNQIIEDDSNISEVFRAKRLNEMASTTLLKNRDKIENKINPGLMLASKSLENMNKILPSLEADMIDELGINGALNSFKDVNVMLKETIELAINITEISSKNTEALMLEVMEIADTANNLKYIESAQKRRTNFQNKFEKALITSTKKQEENYIKAKQLVEEYKSNETLTAMLESYSTTEIKQIESKKEEK